MPEAISRPFSLGRSRRLIASGDFARLKTTGRRLAHGTLVLNWAASNGSECRLGVVTSRKVGCAVIRNRSRRWVREAFRVHRHELAETVDIVVVARPSIAHKDFQTVEADLLHLLRSARLFKG